MAGSAYGTLFRISTWGESHGKAIGVVADGVPAGLPLEEQDIQRFLDRRKPGQNRFATARSEADAVEILSGVFDGKTTGTPISMLVRNTDQRSRDYSQIADRYRPGHADEAFDRKYGFRDYRGGGRSSGRETIGRVAAGAIASKILARMGIDVFAYTSSIGPVSCAQERFDRGRILESPLYMPDEAAEREAVRWLDQCREDQTSSGGAAECRILGLPSGIGEPVFDKLDALLGQAMFSIGAVKAVEVGDGIAVSKALGHENNDQYALDPQGNAVKTSDHAGGIYGGISDGSPVRLKVHFKPTPSVALPQQALRSDGGVEQIQIRGRHDPVIVPRAVVVVECMAAITVLDLLMRNLSATMDGLCDFYARRGR